MGRPGAEFPVCSQSRRGKRSMTVSGWMRTEGNGTFPRAELGEPLWDKAHEVGVEAHHPILVRDVEYDMIQGHRQVLLRSGVGVGVTIRSGRGPQGRHHGQVVRGRASERGAVGPDPRHRGRRRGPYAVQRQERKPRREGRRRRSAAQRAAKEAKGPAQRPPLIEISQKHRSVPRFAWAEYSRSARACQARSPRSRPRCVTTTRREPVPSARELSSAPRGSKPGTLRSWRWTLWTGKRARSPLPYSPAPAEQGGTVHRLHPGRLGQVLQLPRSGCGAGL